MKLEFHRTKKPFVFTNQPNKNKKHVHTVAVGLDVSCYIL